MTILLPEIAMKYIEGIQEWFRTSMGFEITKNEVCNFAVATLGEIPYDDNAVQQRFKFLDGGLTVKLSPENTQKFEELYYQVSYISMSRKMLLTSLIFYRLLTLPNLHMVKELRVIKEKQGMIDKEKYHPRLMKLLEELEG